MNKRNPPVEVNLPEYAAEVDELNFDDDKPTIDSDDLHRNENVLTTQNDGLTEASQPGQGPTYDDLTPETLIREDGARSPRESDSSNASATDKSLSIVNESEIGAGRGLDEAELAELDPVHMNKVPPKK
jgi:hypothetical protein